MNDLTKGVPKHLLEGQLHNGGDGSVVLVDMGDREMKTINIPNDNTLQIVITQDLIMEVRCDSNHIYWRKRGMREWEKEDLFPIHAAKSVSCEHRNYPRSEEEGEAEDSEAFARAEMQDSEIDVEVCDECGFRPAIGNVVYEDSGKRPLCRCNHKVVR